MRIANKIGARYTVIIGEEELSKDMVTLRNMQTKEQKKIKLDGNWGKKGSGLGKRGQVSTFDITF
jgi:histidyl-tRNA synthetase